ncbi:hypothetical protein CK910_06900 [Aeromonas sp. CA23]|uniref:hypothetical protein n=1 Tax=Aeromonas sp. CA23 TaxID=2033032 RepID=UPI000BFBDDB2|nr:hypothetical protein [Aeromonas sp. CA23]ATL98245.1 hypothetical protein CK910_06900 [Aeromonas sp. CA23]
MPKIVITTDNLSYILSIINTWEGKLTWDLLCQKVTNKLNIAGGVQRQSLSSYKQIQEAYTKRKQTLREGLPLPIEHEDVDATIKYLSQRIVMLEIERDQLKSLNESYKQRFIKWQYNAYRHGIRMTSIDNDPIDISDLKKLRDILEKPLTGVKR